MVMAIKKVSNRLFLSQSPTAPVMSREIVFDIPSADISSDPYVGR